jgi:hypothetical protein
VAAQARHTAPHGSAHRNRRNGLMTLFFFVVGLEARREFDFGEQRERRRLLLPLLAGLGGIVEPVARGWPPKRSEAAAAQGALCPMHDLLLAHQNALSPRDLIGYAEQLGLDVDRFSDELDTHRMRNRIAEDVEWRRPQQRRWHAHLFVNGRRHYGASTSAVSPRRYTLPAHARRSPPSDQAASGGLVLLGEVGRSETFERHPEGDVLRRSVDDG